MKNDHYEKQQAYLLPASKVGVAISLDGGGLFRGAADIVEAGAQMLTLRLATDEIRANAGIAAGSLLGVSIETEKGHQVSNAIVTKTDGEELLWVHLFGGFHPGELHKVFRLEGSMKIRYWLVTQMDEEELENDWDRRRHLEHSKFQGLGELALAAERARYRPPRELEWRDLKRAEVSLGTDGINLKLPECVQPDQLVYLEIHLPLVPTRQIYAVAQVLAVKAPVQTGRRVAQEAGMRYLFLDEKDRNLMLKHITVGQRGRLSADDDEDDPTAFEQTAAAGGQPAATTSPKQRSILLPVLLAFSLLCVILYAVNFYRKGQYASYPDEIQSTYEKSIKQYRHQGQ
jgi:hypothetical protein